MTKRTAQSLKSEARHNLSNALMELEQASIILTRQCEDPATLRAIREELGDLKFRVEAFEKKL